MLPVKSNTTDQGCTPTSSNCVIWQGPNLPCINLCKGDTVSDVVYKLATEICTLQTQLDLSALDLSCLVQACQGCPDPVKTLSVVLDMLINKVCTISEVVFGAGTGNENIYVEPTLNLPLCLQYVNAQGVNVTSLIHSTYTLTLATKICEINGTVGTHTSQISGLNTRVTALENAGDFTIPQASLVCLTGTDVLYNVDDAVETVATQLCNLKGVLGSNNDLASAASKQCVNLSSLPALSQTGTMSSISGWKSTITTLSDSINNMWLTICDMRAIIQDLKTTSGTLDCASVIIDYTVAANTNRDQLTLFFAGITSIPAGFSECSQLGSKLTIKDTAGNTYNTFVNVVTNATNTGGVVIDLSSSHLNTQLNYTLTLEPCITKDGQFCSKTVVKTQYAPCTTISITGANIT